MKFIKVYDIIVNIEHIVTIAPYELGNYKYYLELKSGNKIYLTEKVYKEVLKNVLGKKKTRNNKKR